MVGSTSGFLLLIILIYVARFSQPMYILFGITAAPGAGSQTYEEAPGAGVQLA